MSGIELMALQMGRRLREEYDEAYEAELKRLQDSKQPKKAPMTQTPEPAKPEKSSIVLLVFGLLIMSIFLAVCAIAVPSLAPLAVVAGLGAVTFAVLSLREL
jgi:hypothetical protein